MSRRRAFTLLELLLAMALNLVLLAAIATASFVFLRGFQRADRDVNEAQLARAIFGKLSQDLRELCDEPPGAANSDTSDETAVRGDLPPAVLRGTQRDLELIVRDTEPRLPTASTPADPTTPTTEGAVADASQVTYALISPEDAALSSTDSGSSLRLVRERRDWTNAADAEPAPGSTTQPPSVDSQSGAPQAVPSRDYLQVETVSDLRLRYYDGAAWREDWDSQLDGLPRAIEAVLLFRRGANRDNAEPAVLPAEAGLPLPAGGHRLVIALRGPVASAAPSSTEATP